MCRLAWVILGLLALLLTACSGGSGAKTVGTPTKASTVPAAIGTASAGSTPGVRVPKVAADTSIKLPDGFSAYAIADGFESPTSIALAPDGTVFVSASGSVYRLVDTNGDGVFEDRVTFASGFSQINGIMVAPDGTRYVSSTGKITTLRDTNSSGIADAREDIIRGLPTGRHQNNGLTIGPDGKLYFTNGSDCDDCVENDPRSATIQQANIDGSGDRVYAKGLRNSYDLVFDDHGRLWATDNGSDAPCATIDELDLITDGGDYGWPYGEDGCDPYNDGTPPAGDLGLHSASTGITFYNTAQFPPLYRDSLFLTLWGGTFPPVTQPALMWAAIEEPAGAGDPTVAVQQFATGFRHPIDVVADRDGSLLVLDYGTGKLYRILYTG